MESSNIASSTKASSIFDGHLVSVQIEAANRVLGSLASNLLFKLLHIQKLGSMPKKVDGSGTDKALLFHIQLEGPRDAQRRLLKPGTFDINYNLVPYSISYLVDGTAGKDRLNNAINKLINLNLIEKRNLGRNQSYYRVFEDNILKFLSEEQSGELKSSDYKRTHLKLVPTISVSRNQEYVEIDDHKHEDEFGIIKPKNSSDSNSIESLKKTYSDDEIINAVAELKKVGKLTYQSAVKKKLRSNRAFNDPDFAPVVSYYTQLGLDTSYHDRADFIDQLVTVFNTGRKLQENNPETFSSAFSASVLVFASDVGSAAKLDGKGIKQALGRITNKFKNISVKNSQKTRY